MTKKCLSPLMSHAKSEVVTDDFRRQSNAKEERSGLGVKEVGQRLCEAEAAVLTVVSALAPSGSEALQ